MSYWMEEFTEKDIPKLNTTWQPTSTYYVDKKAEAERLRVF
jgi:hypothetical protein